jgi:hypothetical protein
MPISIPRLISTMHTTPDPPLPLHRYRTGALFSISILIAFYQIPPETDVPPRLGQLSLALRELLSYSQVVA